MSSQTGVVSSTTGTSGWTNAGNIYTSNGSYATSASINNSAATGVLYALGNGFSIPSTATIDGVGVSIEAKNALSGNGFQIRATSSEARLFYSGSTISSTPPTGVGNQVWTSTADATKVFGGATVLWGATLTPAIVNDASFGFRGQFFNINASAQVFSVDCISITVYYTDAGVSSSQQFFARRF